MIKCPNCGRDNADNFNFCLDCGYDLKAYREAFPDGIPSAPPPPQPAMTNPAGMAMPANLPSSLTPQGVASPLPPAPQASVPAAPPPAVPSTPPPSFSPPTPAPAEPMTFPPMPPVAAQAPSTPLPPAPMPPVPMPPVPMPPVPMAPVSAASPLPPAPTPMPPAPGTESPLASAPPPMSTAQLDAVSMPPPPSSPPRVGTQPATALPRSDTAPPAPVTIPPPSSMPANLPSTGTPAPAHLPSTGTPAPVPGPDLGALAGAANRDCPACGYSNAHTVKFCGNCGKRLDGNQPAAAQAEGGAGRTMFMHAADMSQSAKEKMCKLITIDQSGREGMTFTIKNGETLCGRENGIILFFDDPFVSPTHCKFSFKGGELKVIDQGSLNGVYLRVKDERRLLDGEMIRIGRQLFRYETMKMAAFQVKKADGDSSRIWGSPSTAAFGRLVQILEDGRTGEIRLLQGDRCQLGREVGDIVMPTDGFISGRHCAFLRDGESAVLSDLGSSNGTYVRVRNEADVAHGDFILVGNQMLRVEII